MEASQTTELLTLQERTTREVDAVYERHGYLTAEGKRDQRAVEDKLYDVISKAIVEKRADRGRVAVPRRALISIAFPQVPGPDEWAEQDDPELAAEVDDRLAGITWRLAGMDATSKIQARLNEDTGLILCHTKATPDKTDAVYVTRDWQCLAADFCGPQNDRIGKAVTRFSKNLAMAAERLPELGPRFKRELHTGMKIALGAGDAILAPALEAAKADLEDEAEDDDGE